MLRAQNGIAMIEPLISISILASLGLGLALFMGRTTKSLAAARTEAQTACKSPSCSDGGAVLRCVCDRASWTFVP